MPDGPGGFAQNSSCSALLRIPLGHIILRIRNYHPLWLNFPEHSSRNQHATSRSYNPADALPQQRFGLFPVRSPLLGESLDYFLFLQVLRCFSSLRSPPHEKCGEQPFRLLGCPIRKSPDQRSFAPTRSLSQLITSFIASESQGIHQTP